MMSRREKLANEACIELQRAMAAYLTNQWTPAQFLKRLEQIVAAMKI